MRNTISTILASAALLSASTAAATTLATPIVFPDGGNQILCSVVNVYDDREVVVTVEVVGFDGQVLESSEQMSVAPGAVGGVNLAAADEGQYCRFRLHSGSRRAVRASACVFEHGTGCISNAVAE